MSLRLHYTLLVIMLLILPKLVELDFALKPTWAQAIATEAIPSQSCLPDSKQTAPPGSVLIHPSLETLPASLETIFESIALLLLLPHMIPAPDRKRASSSSSRLQLLRRLTQTSGRPAHCAWNANQQQDAKTKEFAVVPMYTADRQGVASSFVFELTSGVSVQFARPSGAAVLMSESTDGRYGKDYPMHGATAGRDASAVLVGSLRTTDTEVAISTLRGCCDGNWTAEFDVAVQQALLCMVGPKTLEYCACLGYFPIGF